MQVRYALERLFDDQDPAIVIDTIPAVLAWAPKKSRRPAIAFALITAADSPPSREEGTMALTWNLDALLARDPTVTQRAARMREGTSPHREHLTEVAGYGLALCAVSVLLPARRVVAWSRYVAPDLLFDVTPDALRGVEVAARSGGGASKLREIEREKTSALRADPIVAEAWLSLWCQRPGVGVTVQVKP